MTFNVLITADGSPTLAHATTGEAMHNARGAAGETEFCYVPVVTTLLAAGETPKLISVGLGIGTIEAAVAREAIVTAGSVDAACMLNWQMESYESEQLLLDGLSDWLSRSGDVSVPLCATTVTTPAEVAPWFAAAARTIAGNIGEPAVRTVLRRWRERGLWKLHGALTSTALPPKLGPANGIFWDAFSAKTTPALWDEVFLAQFLKLACAPRCALATYASKGLLRRALAQAGFECLPRGGFGGKRESTFALRGFKLP